MQSCPAEAIRKATVEDNQQMTTRQLDESIVQLLPYMRSLLLPDVYSPDPDLRTRSPNAITEMAIFFGIWVSLQIVMQPFATVF